MVEQTQHNLISPVCDDNYITIAVNFRKCVNIYSKYNFKCLVFFSSQLDFEKWPLITLGECMYCL